jgi:acetate---CoA ligase (ADP-forming)
MPKNASHSGKAGSRSMSKALPNDEALRALLYPRSVAVIGVSDDPTKHNRIAFENLRAGGFAGRVYPVNRRLREVAGVTCYPNPAALPEPVDLALMAIPAEATAEAVRECARAGVKVAILGSAGYAESGPEGAERQRDLAEIASREGIRIVGPNCNGIYNATIGLAVGFNTAHARRLTAGDVAILSHSGALFDTMAGRLTALGAGLSVFVSAGNEVDLDLLDYLEYVIEDAATRVVALVLDGVSDGNRFRLLCERARRLGKPLVALKIGTSEIGAAAAVAHSSRLAAGARAYAALFEAGGVSTVTSLEGLMTAAALLSFYGKRQGGLAAFSTSGVGAALIADLCADLGISLTRFGDTTSTALDHYRRFSQIGNPTDLGIFGGSGRAFEVPALIAADPGVGVMMALMHSLNPWQRGYAEAIAHAGRTSGKPLLVVAPGGLSEEEISLYAAQGLRVFDDTVTTLQGIAAMLTPARAYPSFADTLAGEPETNTLL